MFNRRILMRGLAFLGIGLGTVSQAQGRRTFEVEVGELPEAKVAGFMLNHDAHVIHRWMVSLKDVTPDQLETLNCEISRRSPGLGFQLDTYKCEITGDNLQHPLFDAIRPYVQEAIRKVTLTVAFHEMNGIHKTREIRLFARPKGNKYNWRDMGFDRTLHYYDTYTDHYSFSVDGTEQILPININM